MIAPGAGEREGSRRRPGVKLVGGLRDGNDPSDDRPEAGQPQRSRVGADGRTDAAGSDPADTGRLYGQQKWRDPL